MTFSSIAAFSMTGTSSAFRNPRLTDLPPLYGVRMSSMVTRIVSTSGCLQMCRSKDVVAFQFQTVVS